MQLGKVVRECLRRLVAFLVNWLPLLKHAEVLPLVSRHIEASHDKALDHLHALLRPYQGRLPVFAVLPPREHSREDIRSWVKEMAKDEDSTWREGFASGAVYHGDAAHIEFLNEIYALTSQSNPLHSDIWPSSNKFIGEIVAMTGAMLGSACVRATKVGGSVTSGGTESIMLAMKTYRDWARKERGISRPEALIPLSAHPAFDKACEYFGIKKVTIPLDAAYKADLRALRKAITRRSIVIVGSAPSFPHGVIDPIGEMAAIAQQHGLGFHSDACLGGFILPWLDARYQVPAFDFRVEGVTSISVDTHKYGYASKGSSVLLFRDEKMRHHQYFTSTDWPGGLYFSPTFAGSRSGAVIAQCWASLLSMGQDGYRQAAAEIMRVAVYIQDEIKKIPGMQVLGDPLWVIAFTSSTRNIYDIMEKINKKGWRLNGLQRPSCLHICLTLRHTHAGVAERFIRDLSEAAREAEPLGSEGSGLAPIYGMAAQIPLRGVVAKFLKKYLDRLYEV